MFTTGYSEPQLEAMNEALIDLCGRYGYRETRAAIVKLKTAFFQDKHELHSLVRTHFHHLDDYRGLDFTKVFETSKTDVYNRLTHKYRDGWSGEDDWAYAGYVEHLGSHLIDGDDCNYTGHHVYRLLSLSAGVDVAAMKSALLDHHTRSRCRCEHDCCGCWSHSASQVDVFTVGMETLFMVHVSGAQNY